MACQGCHPHNVLSPEYPQYQNSYPAPSAPLLNHVNAPIHTTTVTSSQQNTQTTVFVPSATTGAAPVAPVWAARKEDRSRISQFFTVSIDPSSTFDLKGRAYACAHIIILLCVASLANAVQAFIIDQVCAHNLTQIRCEFCLVVGGLSFFIAPPFLISSIVALVALHTKNRTGGLLPLILFLAIVLMFAAISCVILSVMFTLLSLLAVIRSKKADANELAILFFLSLLSGVLFYAVLTFMRVLISYRRVLMATVPR